MAILYQDGDTSIRGKRLLLKYDENNEVLLVDTNGVIQAAGSSVANDSITNAKLATDVKVGSLAALTTTAKGSVVAAIDETKANADGRYTKPALGIPKTDLVAAVGTSLDDADSAYQKPGAGIPKTDLAATVGTSLDAADSAYQLPGAGIPKADLVTAVQTSLDKADTALQVVQVASATPVNAVAANKKLETAGTADDGETVTIGTEVYEFDADASVGGTNIAVDIAAGTKAQATVKLTLSGAVGEEETFSIGSETYEADYDDSVDPANIRLDLSAAASAAVAEGVFTLTSDVSDTETVTIDTTVFEFDTNGAVTAGNEMVSVAGNVGQQAACVALASVITSTIGDIYTAVAAVGGGTDWTVTVTAKVKGTHMNVTSTETCANGSWASGTLTGGVDGTDSEVAAILIVRYNAITAYDITAAADGGTAIDFTADAAGAQDGSVGNTIATDDTGLVAGAFSSAYLAGGYDCTEAQAAAALLAKINSDSAIVDATDAGSNDVVVTAKTKGILGNSIALAETMDNAAWAGAAVLLSGGIDGTVGAARELAIDAAYLYVAIATNTIADNNWRRIDLLTVY